MTQANGATVDQTMPDGKWAFDSAVTDVFEDMLRRSIPAYDAMRAHTLEIGTRFVRPNTAVIDFGCSRGDALMPFVSRFGAQNQFIGIEISEPMQAVARERFAGYANVDIRHEDLRHYYPTEQASVTLGVLTAQFVAIEHRQRLIRKVQQNLVPGGAFILVEKILGATADLDDLLVELYYDMKHRNGYTWEQIQRKRMSLEGVLVPLTAAGNEELLRGAGFTQLDCLWRDLNFAGWVAVKT